jgi:hypothetical protein
MNPRDEDDDPRIADLEDRRDYGRPRDTERALDAYEAHIYGDHP